MPKYLDPKNDLPFKRIFGEHPDLLKSFLNAVMPLEGRKIESLEYLPAEQVPQNPAKKNSIVDVRCKDDSGRQFIVEMQMLWTPFFARRLLFNTAKAYVQQLNKSENYGQLDAVYGLAIINDVYDNKTPDFFHHYLIMNKENVKDKVDGIELVMVELPKFRPESWADRRMAVLWLRFLREVKEHVTEVPEDLCADDDIRKALEICEAGAFTEAELRAYEDYWDAVRIERSFIADGEKKGRIEGEEKGRIEGREEGREEKLIDVVRNCKRNGLSLEVIKMVTNLSEEKILEILSA